MDEKVKICGQFFHCRGIVYGIDYGCKEAIWIMKLFLEVRISHRVIIVQCDSNSTICLAKNQKFHAKTKHIDIHYHFVRDTLEDGKGDTR